VKNLEVAAGPQTGGGNHRRDGPDGAARGYVWPQLLWFAYKKQMSQPEIASHHGQQTEGGRRPKIFPDARYFLMHLCVTGASDGAASCRVLVVDVVFH
jgi:hypothetical protein